MLDSARDLCFRGAFVRFAFLLVWYIRIVLIARGNRIRSQQEYHYRRGCRPCVIVVSGIGLL